MEVHELSSSLLYQALSYTWQDSTLDGTSDILINGQRFAIYENLYHFLCLHSAKEQHCTDALIWIDQLCIDQNNLAERNHQVAQMAQIYALADETIVWLGSGIHLSSVFKADWVMDTVREPWDWIPPPSVAARSLRITYEEDLEHLRDFPLLALALLARRAYWHRVWIVQEVLLSKKLRVRYGIHEIDWEDLERFYDACREYMGNLQAWHQYEIRMWRERGSEMLALRSHGRWLRSAQTQLQELIESRRSWIKEGKLKADADGERARASPRNETSPNTTGFTWWRLLTILRERSCKDVRDTIFGLLGLVDPRVAIAVDYSMSAREIFEQVLRAEARVSGHRFISVSGSARTLEPSGFEFVGGLGLALKCYVTCDEAVRIIEEEIEAGLVADMARLRVSK
jgi:hypothetical protein